MELWPPSSGRTKQRWEEVVASPPLSWLTIILSFNFWFGMEASCVFMQEVMANEVATAWPGKERETKGRGGQV